MVQNKLNAKTLVEKAADLSFPSSVIEFMQGKIGQAPYGFPEPLRSRMLRGKPTVDQRPGKNLKPIDFEALKTELQQKHKRKLRDVDVVSAALYPRVFNEFETFRAKYGPVDKLDTRVFLCGLKKGQETDIELEKGKLIHVQLVTEGELRENGEREVFFDYNGQMRSVFVKDNEATKSLVQHPKADPAKKGSIGAPMPGEVLEIKVKEGDKVKAKTPLIVLSAMKMEMVIESQVEGTVKQILVKPKMKCAGGDLMLEIE
uniref:Lipoyl-binding domain-containing protein n=1 Tax=Romanomermis culicivorax TaxID=13658 RepID=A0A915J9J3_ROMCU